MIFWIIHVYTCTLAMELNVLYKYDNKHEEPILYFKMT